MAALGLLFVIFLLLLWSVWQGVYLAYPLALILLLLGATLSAEGFSLVQVLRLALKGGRKAWPVIQILLLIGAVMAIWMAAGTVPAMVYYGLQIIHPRFFILWAFLLTSLVSTIIGTSFGTAGTIGIALMVMTAGSDVNPHLVAGAIIAGAYVGDRCSPMSSSAYFVATLTQTDLYANLSAMLRTGGLPLLLTCGAYLLLSLGNPVHGQNQILLSRLAQEFELHPLLLLPAGLMLVLAVLRVPVPILMGSSVLAGGVLAFGFQSTPWGDLLRVILLGYRVEADPLLQRVLSGGGVLAMARVCLVVVLSTALAELLGKTQFLQKLQHLILKARTRVDLFLATLSMGILAAALGCTQTIGILLTQQTLASPYQRIPDANSALALDLENTVVVLAPLIPWNIAGLVPATLLQVSGGYVPFAVFLYLLPLVVLMQLSLQPVPLLLPDGRREGDC